MSAYERTDEERRAGPGECLLHRHPTWQPENDCTGMTVPQMIMHIYKNRNSLAVAPNGHTCPFITIEEFGRIADFIEKHFASDL